MASIPSVITSFTGSKVQGVAAQKSVGNDMSSSFQTFLQKSSQGEVAPKRETPVEVPAEKNAGKEAAKETGEKQNMTAKPQVATVDRPEEEDAVVIKDFLQKLRRIMGLTEEEMNLWLGTLGIQGIDLMDAGSLQKFFLQVKGIDVSTLLTESTISDQLKECMTLVKEMQTVQLPDQSKTQASEFADFLQESIGQGVLMQAPVKEEAVSTVKQADETMPFLEQQQKESVSETPVVSKEMPEAMASAFSKVVETREEVVLTAQGMERTVTTVSVQDIFRQIVTRFSAQVLQSESRITVQLSPENLGRVAFQVVSREGQVTGQFVAENEAVKAALEAQVTQLKEHLTAQGIKVQEVKVVVGDALSYFAEDRPKEEQQTSKRKNRRIAEESMEIEEIEVVEEETVQHSDSQIDFMA